MVFLHKYWKLILGCILVLLYPIVLSSGSMISIGTMIAIYGIVGMSLGLLTGESGQISLGQAAFFGVGAYTTSLLAISHVPHLLALILGGIVAGIVGLLVGLTSFRLQLSYLAMATIAFQLIFISMAKEWSGLTGGINGLSGIPSFSIFFYRLTSIEYYYFSWIIAFIVLWIITNILRSSLGLSLATISNNQDASVSIGVFVNRHKLEVFFISAVLSGLAGGVFAFYLSWVGPDSFNLHVSVIFLSIMILGGVRPIWGGILGAITIVILPELISAFVGLPWLPEWFLFLAEDYAYQSLLFSVITLLVLIFIPGGLVRLVEKRGHKSWTNPS